MKQNKNASNPSPIYILEVMYDIKLKWWQKLYIWALCVYVPLGFYKRGYK